MKPDITVEIIDSKSSYFSDLNTQNKITATGEARQS